jgi:hypothetical protein
LQREKYKAQKSHIASRIFNNKHSTLRYGDNPSHKDEPFGG